MGATLRAHARRWLKACWFELLLRSGLIGWARWRLRRTGCALVVNLHRILDDAEFDATHSPAGMVMRTRTFAALVAYVARRHPLIDLRRCASPPATGLALALTFDDGWEDNVRNAAPLLRQAGAPACIFLCPGRMDSASPYWPETAVGVWRSAVATNGAGLTALQALLQTALGAAACQSPEDLLALLKRLAPAARGQVLAACVARFPAAAAPCDRTMRWDEARSLREGDICFGSHTMHHEILSNLDAPAMDRELAESRRLIAVESGEDLALFSYPNGDWNAAARARVEAAGYRLAFANDPGVWCADTDPLAIPRINLSEGKVTGPDGRFSVAALSYYLIWQPWRVHCADRH
ncbi:MAG: polysaccharide deacetylase family protein [Pseudomonadota bacterium]|nr:polysaccharide deacetylase family protein [Pseudomonadota bacterium]